MGSANVVGWIKLNNLNAGSLWTFSAFSFFVLNGVTFLELTAINLVDVDEQILASPVGLNEAKTFLVEKTSYFACCHNIYLNLNALATSRADRCVDANHSNNKPKIFSTTTTRTQTEISSGSTDPHWDSVKKSRCILGIEPNEHRIPRFQWKYSYHTDHSENPERPNSPNVFPMSQHCWGVGFFVSVNLSVSLENLREQWDWDENPLNFSESEWWGKIPPDSKHSSFIWINESLYRSILPETEKKNGPYSIEDI